jgi:NAD(P)-dependent dehydrogenase (short-subunit alcohol dehydrogenase family)
MSGLRDRVAIITGSGTGIGFAAAKVLAERGALVVIAEIDPQSGAQAAAALTNAGLTARFIQTDVADVDSIEAMVAEAIAAFGRIDILINNVGVTIREPFEALTLEHWNNVIAINLTSMMLCVKACLPYLRASPHAAIVNLTSVNAERTIPGMGAYPATKAGIIGLTHSLAVDLAPHIRVNAVAPGVVLTDAWRNQMVDVESAIAHRLRYIPRGRVGTPEDVGRAIAFLASDEADFITGTVLTVDGGMHAKLYAD